MYWSRIASGEFAIHFSRTAACGSPLITGRSRYRGGLSGLGDHAAELAMIARAKNGSFAESAGVFTSSIAFAISGDGGGKTDRQQGLMMYSAPNTSACFMPMRVAP